MAFARYQFRRDTAANWTSANPVLFAGELGYETDTQKFKLGNGTTAWNSLPYGGIKGDTGATGAAGVSPTVMVGATTVVTPVTNPSVTDADAGPNADLRFSLPRARNVTAGTTTTGAAGTSASVTSQADANGDITLNFTIPRGDTGATGAQGPQGPAGQSVAVADEGTSLTAAATSINFTGGGVTVTNSGSAVTVNVPAPPTPPTPANAAPPAIASTSSTGTTTTEFALEDHTHAGVTSVNTRQGAVTLTKADVGLANAGNPVAVPVVVVADAAFTNATIASTPVFTIPANTLVVGNKLDFKVTGSAINTTTASNLIVRLLVNGANVLELATALGTTAVAAPGRGFWAEGSITVRSVGAAGTVLAEIGSRVNNLANFNTNEVAVDTVNTTAAVTVQVQVLSSAATTTGTLRTGHILQSA